MESLSQSAPAPKKATPMDAAGDSVFTMNGIVPKTLIDHSCALGDGSIPLSKRLSTIICTVGPVSRDVTTLEKMIGAGMNVARLDLCHGSHEYHTENILNIRKAVEFFNKKHVISFPLAIALDTMGPEIRTGRLEGDDSIVVELKEGVIVIVTTDKDFADKGSSEIVYVDYCNITKVVKTGDKVMIDNGHISLVIVNVGSNQLDCMVENGGILGSRMLVNLPGVPIDLPAVTDKDKLDIEFGANHKVDIIFASCIRSARAVDEVRAILGEKCKKTMVVSKIENHQGMMNLDQIIEASDGIMIVRGKLANEISPEKVFAAQKTIIARCNRVGKPVICANQMLESTVTKKRPTRSEITDVANAIMSGADCLLLSNETATGEHPLGCIDTMANICKEAEAAIWQKQLFLELVSMIVPPVGAVHTVAIAAVEASFKCSAVAIIVITTSGKAARLVSRYRPRCPIISVTRNGSVARQNHLYRGIMSVHYKENPLPDWTKDVDVRIQFALMLGHNRDFIKKGDPVVIIHGWKKGLGFTNTMKVIYVPENHDMNVLPTGASYFCSLGNEPY